MFHFFWKFTPLELNLHYSLIYALERKSSLIVWNHVWNMIAFPAEKEEDTVMSAFMCCVHASCHDYLQFFSTTRTLGIVGLFIHSVLCITLLCRQLQPTPQSKGIFFHMPSIYACFVWNIYSSRYILDYQINKKYNAYMAYFSFGGF